eukprot:6200014-Pleurochrysis_carterae.AAC.2
MGVKTVALYLRVAFQSAKLEGGEAPIEVVLSYGRGERGSRASIGTARHAVAAGAPPHALSARA